MILQIPVIQLFRCLISSCLDMTTSCQLVNSYEKKKFFFYIKLIAIKCKKIMKIDNSYYIYIYIFFLYKLYF